MASKTQRPGLQPLTSLDQKLRSVLEPLTDLVARVIGSSLKPLPPSALLEKPFLDGTETLLQVIDRVNLIHFTLNKAVTDQNAVKDRLQED